MSMGSRYPWWWRYGDHVEADVDKRVHTLPVPHTVEGGAAAAQKGGSRVVSHHRLGALQRAVGIELTLAHQRALFRSICMAAVDYQVTESVQK